MLYLMSRLRTQNTGMGICNEITELHWQVFLFNLILDCFFLFIIFDKVQIDTSRLLGLFFFSEKFRARQKKSDVWIEDDEEDVVKT